MSSLKNIIKSIRWSKFERVILILTLLCTLTITIYSIKTSQVAITQSKINLRPWVSLPSIHTQFHMDNIEIRQKVENIGNIPCYVKIIGEITYSIENNQNTKRPGITNILVLLPKQHINYGYTISGNIKEKVLEKDPRLSISIGTTVYYSEIKSDIEKYYTYSKSDLFLKNLPQKIATGEPIDNTESGIWRSIESHFR